MLKEKLKLIFWPIAYGLIIIGLCVVSCYVFSNNYYSSIYVSGESMYPTLSGRIDDADYGISDKHDSALKKVKRWQVLTTHYPGDNRLMIKRLLFLPGDEFKVEEGEMYLKKEGFWMHLAVDTDDTFHRNMEHSGRHRSYPVTVLGENQYFVAGDNWDSSLDCFTIGPIDYSNLVGVVVAMEGRCRIENEMPVDKKPYSSPHYFMGVDF